VDEEERDAEVGDVAVFEGGGAAVGCVEGHAAGLMLVTISEEGGVGGTN
jgi:hypothetical protein